MNHSILHLTYNIVQQLYFDKNNKVLQRNLTFQIKHNKVPKSLGGMADSRPDAEALWDELRSPCLATGHYSGFKIHPQDSVTILLDSLPPERGLDIVDNLKQKCVGMWLWRGGHEATVLSSLLTFCFGFFILGKGSCRVMRDPTEGPRELRWAEAFCQEPTLSCVLVQESREWTFLEKDPPCPVKSTDDFSPGPRLDHNLMTDLSPKLQCCCQMPNSQKLCEIVSACCFKKLRFGVFCYTAIDNKCRYNWK